MKRSAPLKRTGFKRPPPPTPRGRQWTGHTPDMAPAGATLRRSDGKARLTVQVPKDNALQHAAYMAAVRTLPCDRCGISGFTQFCHADILGRGGKGKGLKSDCRLGWPGCGPHHDLPGCHYDVGTGGTLTKQQRHEYEAAAGQRTREKVRALGLWPKSLPAWPGDTEGAN